jgi:hypothetical protein
MRWQHVVTKYGLGVWGREIGVSSHFLLGFIRSCDEIFYDIQGKDKDDYQQDEIESSKTNLEGWFNFLILTHTKNSNFHFSSEPVSAIHVMFAQNQFDVKRRSERYGFIDFISNCGGLMGLFMGISILSFVEIAHYLLYFIYQLVCNFDFRRQDNRVYSLKQWNVWECVFIKCFYSTELFLV